MKTALEILKEARAIIATPGKWTKGEFARDKEGNKVGICSPDASQFCAVGAINRIGRAAGDVTFARAAFLEAEPAGVWFNDHPNTTHADVLAAFDRAIAKLEAEGTPA